MSPFLILGRERGKKNASWYYGKKGGSFLSYREKEERMYWVSGGRGGEKNTAYLHCLNKKKKKKGKKRREQFLSSLLFPNSFSGKRKRGKRGRDHCAY